MTDISPTLREICNMVDISAVQATQGRAEIQAMVAATQEHGFGCIFCLPAWVTFTKALLKDVKGVLLGAPVGYPSGGHHTEIKVAEARLLAAEGCDELDMVLNVGRLRSGDYDEVLHDIRSVVQAVDVPVKVIIESPYLTDEQKRAACQLCIEGGADWVKTSTGWAPTGATVEDVALLSECAAGKIGVKAAGGIRDLETLVAMYRAGARRFGLGTGSALTMVETYRQSHPDQAGRAL